MKDQNIFSIFSGHFPRDPQAVFLETGAGETYSYADLERESARLARYLTELGIAKGDRVAVQVEKSPQALFLYLACLRAGFIYLPLNTAYTSSELEYFLEDAEPAGVVCRPGSPLEALAPTKGVRHVLTLDAQGGGSLTQNSAALAPEFETVACAGDDVAVILYTSGTTGRPKGAMLPHRALAANGLALRDAWRFTSEDILLHALPIFHIHGLFVACHCVLLSGARMLFEPKFDTRRVIELLPRATVLMGVPTFYTRLLAEPDFDAKTCANMRLFVSGSAPLLEQTFEEFRARTGHTILERYGMTETGMNTSNPLEGERRPGTVGLPLPGVEVKVVDDEDRPLPAGEAGNLLVRGPNLFLGYWRMPEKTAEEFTADGYFRTGDIAAIDADGYVSIVGRAKDMIISGGYNVYPKEVESRIDALEGVSESAVIGVAHPDYGEAVVAVLVPEPGAAVPGEAEVIAALRKELAGYKVPKRVFFAEELPRNTMGKVQKNRLRETYADTFSG